VQAATGTGTQAGSVPPGPGKPTKSTSSTTGTPSTVAVAITWRTSFGVIGQGSRAVPASGPSKVSSQVGCGSRPASAPVSRALSAALMMSPASPDPTPTASEEQLVDGIASVILALKLVQPLKAR
jgi:hypothetical protein